MPAKPHPSLTWLALPLLLAGKQLMAARFAWDYGLGKRVLVGQALFALLASIALVVLLRLVSGRRHLAVYLALDAVLSLVLLGDVLHVRQFGTPLSASMLRYAYQLATVKESVWALIEPRYFLLFADLPALWVMFRFRPLWQGLDGLRPRSGVAALALVVACTGAGAGLERSSLEVWSGYTGVVWRFGFLNYHVVDGFKVVSSAVRRHVASPETRGRLLEAMASRRKASLPGRFYGSAKGSNLVVIQVESLQSIALGMRVGGVDVTPNLDALARESVVATSFYHQTGPGRTSDADLLFNCSIYPTTTESVYFEYEHNAFYCLPRLLAETGYHTAAFQATYGDLWNVSRIYKRLGYQDFAALENFTLDDVNGLGLSDASFLRQSLGRIVHMPQPFFAFLVTITSHVPYEYGLALPDGPLKGTMVGRYFEAIKYTDAQIGKFVDGLRASGLLDRTILVVYGDHDGLQWTPELAHSLALTDCEVNRFMLLHRVPLIMRFPGGQGAGAFDEPLGQIDVAPTLAGALGVSLDGTSFFGREAGSRVPPALVFPLGEALDANHLYLPARGPGTPAECWALKSHARAPDPACAGLADHAGQDLRMSHELLEYDLQAGTRGTSVARVAP